MNRNKNEDWAHNITDFGTFLCGDVFCTNLFAKENFESEVRTYH
jgi:hypothetical protein